MRPCKLDKILYGALLTLWFILQVCLLSVHYISMKIVLQVPLVSTEVQYDTNKHNFRKVRSCYLETHGDMLIALSFT